MSSPVSLHRPAGWHPLRLLPLVVALVFLAYYAWASQALPLGAGPDYAAHNDISRFIYEHRRLPVLPEDEAALYFSPQGGTRALRPPLSYLVSALAAGLVQPHGERERWLAFRLGSALLVAMAVALVFWTVRVYLDSVGWGLLAAGLYGLWPQIAFIASYNNDDSGALFAASALLAAITVLYRRGPSLLRMVGLAVAAGWVIAAKFTAWLLLPWALLALILFVRAPLKRWLYWLSWMVPTGLAAGGWWLLFNAYHYGWGDLLQQDITRRMIERHRRLPADQGVGFIAQGRGLYDLLIGNYRNFLGATFRSVVGNLDWLRLPMGPLQYGLYGLLGISGLGRYLAGCVGAWRDRGRRRQWGFESLLIGMILFQLVMYAWSNVYNDIQIQGKYLLPVAPAFLMLALAGLQGMGSLVERILTRHADHWWCVSARWGRRWAVAGALAVVGLVHGQALVSYVFPFYRPPVYEIRAGHTKTLSAAQLAFGERGHLELKHAGEAVVWRATGPDPWVRVEGICRHLGPARNLLMALHWEAEQAGVFQVFVDEGEGFSEKRSVTRRYPAGPSVLIFPLTAQTCQGVRFDPAAGRGRGRLERIELTVLRISPRR